MLIADNRSVTCGFGGALGGTRTPNLLIRSQMLYPLSYERGCQTVYGTLHPRCAELAIRRRAQRLKRFLFAPRTRSTAYLRHLLAAAAGTAAKSFKTVRSRSEGLPLF